MTARIRFINPKSLSRPPSYTQVVEVSGPGRTIYISGQLGIDAEGTLVSREFSAQAAQVFENLEAALATVGASFKDVVKINSYLCDISHLPTLREVRARHLDPDRPPASTTLEVSSFARPGALIEVEAVAVLASTAARRPPARGRKVKTPRKRR